MLKHLQIFILNLPKNRLFEFSVIGVIILSSLLIGVKTYDINPNYLNILNILDIGVTLFFLIEISLRFIAEPKKIQFFNKAWNIFDTLIVAISLIPIDESEFALLARLIRIFRVLRLISVIPELRILIGALVKALPSMAYVLLLMFILFYIYAAVGSFIFEAINPVLWGDIAISMLTLFRVITFEDWTDVMYETMTIYPLSWLYYLSFIFFNAFVFLNMMIGIVIEKMQEEHRLSDLDNNKDITLEQTQILTTVNQRLVHIEQTLKNQAK